MKKKRVKRRADHYGDTHTHTSMSAANTLKGLDRERDMKQRVYAEDADTKSATHFQFGRSFTCL